MRMSEIDFEGQPPIDGYGPGGFRIAETWHGGSVIVGPAGVQPLGGISTDGLRPILQHAGDVDIVLIGQGQDVAVLDPAVRTMLEDAGLGVEAMSTPSACRTYNVCLTEDRRVAAALIAMPERG